jgi:hypothetical protein
MKVMLLGKSTSPTSIRNYEAMKPPSDEALLAMHNFNEELTKAGVLLDLGGLMPSKNGARVRYTKKRRTVLDGPFTEAKELVGGYSVIQVSSLAEAIEWAKRAPFGVGLDDDDEMECELRPLFDPSMFDPK